MELTLEVFLIVCPLVFLAGLVDAIGGGGGLISLPAYLIAGLPPHMAVATNEIINGEISSKILLFSLDNSEPYMGKIIGSTLCSAVSFYGDTVFMVCEDGLYMLNKEYDMELVYSFSGKKMKHCKFHLWAVKLYLL